MTFGAISTSTFIFNVQHTCHAYVQVSLFTHKSAGFFCLRNDDGSITNETRLKQSLAKKGKPMNEENKALRRGKPAINRIPVVIDDIEFESKSAAANFLANQLLG